jgi:hypothetical protein
MPKQKDNQVVIHQVTKGARVPFQCKLAFSLLNVTLRTDLFDWGFQLAVIGFVAKPTYAQT